MTKFKYKVVSSSGVASEGVMEASSKSSFLEMVKNEGKLVHYEEVSASAIDGVIGAVMGKLFGRIGTHQKILFAQNLGTMLNSGLSLSRALSVLSRQSHNKKFQEVVNMVGADIQRGMAFNEALAKFPKIFSNLFVSMVKAGEESGNLPESLDVVGGQMEKAWKLKKKIKGAMMYPTIVMIAMFIVGVLMMIFIVPTLTSTFSEMEMELPASTKLIIAISDALRNQPLVVGAGFVAFMTVMMLLLKTKQGKAIVDVVSLKVPVIGGLVRETNSAATMRTLSSLLASGVDVVKSLDITSEVIQHTKYKPVLVKARDTISQGGNISEVFAANENLYPIYVGEMMKVGEETGKISEMMKNVAVYYENEVFEKTQDLSTIVEPILMVIVGGLVGFFVVSIITPMYSLVNAI